MKIREKMIKIDRIISVLFSEPFIIIENILMQENDV